MVAIKDFEMPKNCLDCNLCSNKGLFVFYCDITTNFIDEEAKERPSDCPLIEISEVDNGNEN